MVKLTVEEVWEIRCGIAEGDSDAEIAEIYGVTAEQVRDIADRVEWASLEDPVTDQDKEDTRDNYDFRKFWHED